MPSIGKDLAKIRISLGLSLQDIQSSIKIPISTLEKIENGSIFEDSEHGQTYVRSFIRSYGRALKIDSEVMINGLDQQETGNYNHLLWNYYEGGKQSSSFKSFTFDDLEPSNDDSIEVVQTEKDTKSAIDSPSDVPPDKEPKEEKPAPVEPVVESDDVPQKSSVKKPTQTAPAGNVDWADMGLKFIDTKKTTPVWIFVLLIMTVLIFAVGYFIYANDLFSFADSTTEETENAVIASNNANNLLDLDGPADVSTSDSATGVELDEILYITVYAAYERLEPVRIWSDIKPRMDPYWIEIGTAMNFDFRDTVRIRGQYSNMLIFKNGHAIDDALEARFNQQENYIELTRGDFSVDPKWVSSRPYQTPDGVAEPDTVLFRPTF